MSDDDDYVPASPTVIANVLPGRDSPFQRCISEPIEDTRDINSFQMLVEVAMTQLHELERQRVPSSPSPLPDGTIIISPVRQTSSCSS